MIPDLLSLTQWLSPGFPTGAYAYSHGLEAAISDGTLGCTDSVQGWLSDVLTYGAGWQDAVLVNQALQPETSMQDLDDLARALQPSSGRLAETLDQGIAFAKAYAALTQKSVVAHTLPVAFGAAAASCALPHQTIIALYLHSFAANLVSVAVRFVPLGQNQGQIILHNLHGVIAQIAERASHSSLDDLGSAALGADLAAMQQETLDVRIYKS